MANENLLGGAERIRGELLKLDIKVVTPRSKSICAWRARTARQKPTQSAKDSWAAFGENALITYLCWGESFVSGGQRIYCVLQPGSPTPGDRAENSGGDYIRGKRGTKGKDCCVPSSQQGYIMITGASHDSSEVTGTNTYGVFDEYRHFSTARDFGKSIFKHPIRGATSNDPLGAEIQFREVRSGWSRQPQLPIRHRGL